MAVKRSGLITGCTEGGIGAALAASFANHGLRVFASARDEDDIKVQFNCVKRIIGGTLDYLVINAAVGRFMPLLDENIDEAKKIFDTNVWAPLRMVQIFSPLLIEAKGTVVFITSGAGHMNVPWLGSYAASKRSLEILGDTLRLELAPFDVKVVSVVTGPVKSNGHSGYQNWIMPETSRYKSVEEYFTKRAKGDDGFARMDSHEYAEGVVTKLLGNPGPKFWYGASTSILKFMTSWLPTWWMDDIASQGTGIDVMLKTKK